MTKRRASSPMRQLSRWRSRLIVILSVLLCVLAFLRVFFHSQANLQSSFPTSRRRSRAFIDNQFDGPPKVAFLFLVRWDLLLDFLWGTFFKNGDAAKFSIYIHSKPVFVFDESTTRFALFFGRQLNNSIQVVLLASLKTSTSTASMFFLYITWFQDAFACLRLIVYLCYK